MKKEVHMNSENLLEQLVEDFLKINNQLTQIQKKPIPILDDVRISTSALHLIETIGNYPKLNVTELADKLGVTKGAISQQIPHLHKIGLIEIIQIQGNKKNKLISLTSKGKGVYAAHHSLHKELYLAINKNLSAFSTEQKMLLLEILKKVSFSIDDYQHQLSERDDQNEQHPSRDEWKKDSKKRS